MVNDRRVTLRRPRRGCGRGDVRQEIQFDPCLAAKMDRPDVGSEEPRKAVSLGCIGARIFALEVVAGSNPVKCCGAAYPAVGAFNSG
jgi:hypothetical protein